MKTSVLFCAFFLFITIAHAQLKMHSSYNLYLFTPKNHLSACKKGTYGKNKLDSLLTRNQPFFLQYIPKRKVNQIIMFTDNSSYLGMLGNTINKEKEIDLESTKNRTKLLFFKMKMWRYFRE